MPSEQIVTGPADQVDRDEIREATEHDIEIGNDVVTADDTVADYNPEIDNDATHATIELAGESAAGDSADGTACRQRELIPAESLFLAKVLHCNETELCSNPVGVELHEGDFVVIPTKYGKDIAAVLGPVSVANAGAWKELQHLDRIATRSDISRYEENLRRESHAFEICRHRIMERRMDMKLVSAHYLLEEPKLLFFFTADGRIDFRDLVKDLVGEFRIRIELRQIGVRDESRVLGGMGVCGRKLCCNGVSDKLNPVSIKMAKVQNLSLNSMKISGPCGRLLCCLSYEHDLYVSERKRFPDENTRIPYDETVFRVLEVNIVSRQVRLAGEDGRYLTLPVCRFEREADRKKWRILESDCGGCGEIE